LNESIVSTVITAIIGPILTAMVTYWLSSTRAAKGEAALQSKDALQSRDFQVQQFMDSSVAIRPWDMRWAKWFFIIFQVLWAVGMIVFFSFDAYAVAIGFAMLVLMVGSTFWIRFEPPSRTMKSAEFKLKGNKEQIFQRCLAALQQTGARVGKYDSLEGVIVASWLTKG
jgi:hypothetical protein